MIIKIIETFLKITKNTKIELKLKANWNELNIKWEKFIKAIRIK